MDSVTHTPQNQDKIIAIAASTGGTEAIFTILQALPADIPGIVIVQHIPPVFSTMFAERLRLQTKLEVREGKTGDFVERGTALLAPGGQNMRIKRSGRRYKIDCSDTQKVNGHCPSADVLFSSVAAAAGPHALGIILTGMGRDGAAGLLAMRNAGARTIGQDEKTSVVYGMPRSAYEIGAVERQLGLQSIAAAIIREYK